MGRPDVKFRRDTMINYAYDEPQNHPSLSSLSRTTRATKPLHPLKVERMKRNLTQQMLADFALVSLATVQRAEAGSSIRISSRKQLCDYFNMTPEALGLTSTQVEPPQRAYVYLVNAQRSQSPTPKA